MLRRTIMLVPLMILLVAVPSVLALLYYQYTRDPTFRPLGITIEGLIEAGKSDDASNIVVQISWGGAANTHASPADVRSAIKDALLAHGAESHIEVSDGPPDAGVTVTYLIGANRLGPYPLSRATDGVRATIEARQMIQQVEARKEAEALR